METVNQLQAQINLLQGKIAEIKAEKKVKNEGKLVEECLNLIHGVGKGYVTEDYYAPTRYYSEIPGVKNIRLKRTWDDNLRAIEVKALTPSGFLLPAVIELEGEFYNVEIYESSKYNSEVDY